MERIGVAFLGDMAPPDFVECAQYAEELGYESAWMAEGRCGDQFSVLTACALATERIQLGTCITSVFVRSAPIIGMAAATVDYFSKGRFILGVGSDHKAQVGPMHGLPYGSPIRRLRDAVDIARQLVREARVSYQGEQISIEEYELWFEPFRPEIPVYVASVQEKMTKIAGEIGEGVMTTWHTVDKARLARGWVDTGAARAGKGPGDVDLAQMIPTYVSDDDRTARARMRHRAAFKAYMLPRYRMMMEEAGFAEEVAVVRAAWGEGKYEEAADLVPEALIETFGIVGGPDEAREQLNRFRDAGVTLPMLSLRTPPGIPVSREEAKRQFKEAILGCAPR